MKNKSAIAEKIVIILGLVLILFNAFFWNLKKEDYFLDEKWTFYFANSYLLSIGDFASGLKECNFNVQELIEKLTPELIPSNGERRTLDDIYAMMDAQKGRKFTYFSTFIFTVTDSHPPFYYYLFNTINSAIKGITPKGTGFLINIVALLLTCLFIYKIADYFQGKFCAFSAMLFYGLSFELINSATYYRMYALLTFWITLLLYLYIKWAQSDFDYKSKYLLAICATEICAMMTQFFAAVYIFPVFVLTIILLIVKKRSPKIYIVKHIWTAVIYTVIWPLAIFQVIMDESGEDVRNTASLLNIPSRLRKFGRMGIDSIFAGSKKYFALVAFGIMVYVGVSAFKLIKAKRDGEELKVKDAVEYIYLLVPTIIFYVVTADISPWTVDRYMMPIIPAVAVIMVVFFWKCLKMFAKRELICLGIMLALIAFSFTRVQKMEPYYLYRATEEKKAFIEENKDKSAVIIESDVEMEFVDVLLTVDHPYWTIITVSGLDECLKNKLDRSDSYVFYIGKFADGDKAREVLKENGYKIKKLDYELQFYEAYVADM